MAKVMFLQQIWFPREAAMSLSAALKQAGHKTFRVFQQYSDYYYSNRHHVNASWRYPIKYWFVHKKKISTFG